MLALQCAMGTEKRTAVAIAQRVLKEPLVGPLPVNGLVEVRCHAAVCKARPRHQPCTLLLTFSRAGGSLGPGGGGGGFFFSCSRVFEGVRLR